MLCDPYNAGITLTSKARLGRRLKLRPQLQLGKDPCNKYDDASLVPSQKRFLSLLPPYRKLALYHYPTPATVLTAGVHVMAVDGITYSLVLILIPVIGLQTLTLHGITPLTRLTSE